MLKKIGKWKISILETGNIWLDGGAMMGSVPKVLWPHECFIIKAGREKFI